MKHIPNLMVIHVRFIKSPSTPDSRPIANSNESSSSRQQCYSEPVMPPRDETGSTLPGLISGWSIYDSFNRIHFIFMLLTKIGMHSSRYSCLRPFVNPVKFCILMLYSDDVTGFRQKPKIHPTRFSGLHNTRNRERMALCDV